MAAHMEFGLIGTINEDDDVPVAPESSDSEDEVSKICTDHMISVE